MRPLFALLIAMPAFAQIVPSSSYWVVDPCGGQPAWINSTTIIEESASSGSPCAYTFKSGSTTNPLYDLKTVKQSGGSWSGSTTVTMLTDALTRTHLGGSYTGDCSIGNPDSDGTHFAAIIQDPSAAGGCASSTQSPGSGVGYDLLACNSVTPPVETGCAVLVMSNSSNLGALLDPHIDGNHIYISERNNTGFSNAWATWSVDDVLVNWGGTVPTVTSIALYTPTLPGYWPTFAKSSPYLCEQYYKATGFQHLSNGTTTRFFTQANQVSNYPMPTGSTRSCPTWGLNGYAQSGLFYFDVLVATGAVSNFTQIYPPLTASEGTANCLIPGTTTPACYGEFPIPIPNGDHLFLLFIGTTTTPALLITECSVPSSGCKTQFPSDTLMMDMGTNTQSPAPAAILQQTNFQIPGTPLNATFLGGTGIPGGNYGNCGHLSVNLPSQDLVCTVSTNITNVNHVAASQTTVFSLKYPGSILYPTTIVNPAITISGNVTIK